jgi:hypothetical protein
VDSTTELVNGRKKGQIRRDRRYYVNSLTVDAQAFGSHIRAPGRLKTSSGRLHEECPPICAMHLSPPAR